MMWQFVFSIVFIKQGLQLKNETLFRLLTDAMLLPEQRHVSRRTATQI